MGNNLILVWGLERGVPDATGQVLYSVTPVGAFGEI
jgi:hypothetical protein